MSKILKNTLFNIVILIPYLVSAILVFFDITYKETSLKEDFNQIKSSVDMSNAQFNFFVIVIVLIVTLLSFFIVYVILKIFISIFNRQSNDTSVDIYLSLIISYTSTNLVALILSDFMEHSINIITFITPVLDLVMFSLLYYYNTKNLKNTFILCMGKSILLLLSFRIWQ